MMLRLVFALCLLSFPALAADAPHDPRARDLFQKIRCPVCEAQTIDSSDTDVARDLRALVEKRLAEGQSEEQIMNDLRAAYGDAIVMTPPVKPSTLPLWLAPFALLAIGAAAALALLRKAGRS